MGGHVSAGTGGGLQGGLGPEQSPIPTMGSEGEILSCFSRVTNIAWSAEDFETLRLGKLADCESLMASPPHKSVCQG